MLESGEPCVYLDITHKPADQLRERFPGIYAVCIERGIDLTREPIRWFPRRTIAAAALPPTIAAEPRCTGCARRAKWPAPDCTAPIAWPARRCSNAWFGERGPERHAAEPIARGDDYYFPKVADWRYEHEPADPALITQDWLTIQHTMWNYVGLIRSERRLNRAMRILRELDLEIARFYEKCEVSDSIIGLRNGILTAFLILEAAEQCRESRGCHYRIN